MNKHKSIKTVTHKKNFIVDIFFQGAIYVAAS